MCTSLEPRRIETLGSGTLATDAELLDKIQVGLAVSL